MSRAESVSGCGEVNELAVHGQGRGEERANGAPGAVRPLAFFRDRWWPRTAHAAVNVRRTIGRRRLRTLRAPHSASGGPAAPTLLGASCQSATVMTVGFSACDIVGRLLDPSCVQDKKQGLNLRLDVLRGAAYHHHGGRYPGIPCQGPGVAGCPTQRLGRGTQPRSTLDYRASEGHHATSVTLLTR